MKVNFKRGLENLMQMADAKKPELLTGTGIGLMVLAIPLTVVGTIKAYKKIEARKKEVADDLRENSENPDILVDPADVKLPPLEVAKIVAPYAIAPAVAVVAGAVCGVKACKEGTARTAAAYGMYQLSEAALAKYKEKTKEVVGGKKEDEIHTRVMRDRMEQVLDKDGHVNSVYDTRDGATLCFDYSSGRYFYSDIDYIKSQVNALNADMIEVYEKQDKALNTNNAFLTLNDLYYAIGLPKTGNGENLMWRFKSEGIIKLRPTSILVDGDRPCWVLNFENPPVYIPSRYMDKYWA